MGHHLNYNDGAYKVMSMDDGSLKIMVMAISSTFHDIHFHVEFEWDSCVCVCDDIVEAAASFL